MKMLLQVNIVVFQFFLRGVKIFTENLFEFFSPPEKHFFLNVNLSQFFLPPKNFFFNVNLSLFFFSTRKKNPHINFLM